MLKQKFPHITADRLIVVTIIVWAVSIAAGWLLNPAVTLLVQRLGVPMWIAKNWTWSIIPLFLLFTLYVHRKGWMKQPPAKPGELIKYPHRPDLSTKELWELVDRQKEELERRKHN